jgi:hypothetical protein
LPNVASIKAVKVVEEGLAVEPDVFPNNVLFAIGVREKVLSAVKSPPPDIPPDVEMDLLVGTAPIADVEMLVLLAAVIRPYVSTVNVGTADDDPYEAAVTPVIGNEIVPDVVIVPPDKPPPAVTDVTEPVP